MWLCQSSSLILSWGSRGKWNSYGQEFPNPFSPSFPRRTPRAGRAHRAPRPPRAGAAHRGQAHRGAGKTRYGEAEPPASVHSRGHTQPPALPGAERPKSIAGAEPLPSAGGQGGVPNPCPLPPCREGGGGLSTNPPCPLCVPGLDCEVLYRSGPGVLGDAELKQALLAGECRRERGSGGDTALAGRGCQHHHSPNPSSVRPCLHADPPSCPRGMQLKAMQVQGRRASVESLFFGDGGRKILRFLNL